MNTDTANPAPANIITFAEGKRVSPPHDPLKEIDRRIIALHAHVSKERRDILRDMGLAVWQTYGGDVLATMFHAMYACIDKAIMDPSRSLSDFDLPGDLARRIAELRDRGAKPAHSFFGREV